MKQSKIKFRVSDCGGGKDEQQSQKDCPDYMKTFATFPNEMSEDLKKDLNKHIDMLIKQKIDSLPNALNGSMTLGQNEEPEVLTVVQQVQPPAILGKAPKMTVGTRCQDQQQNVKRLYISLEEQPVDLQSISKCQRASQPKQSMATAPRSSRSLSRQESSTTLKLAKKLDVFRRTGGHGGSNATKTASQIDMHSRNLEQQTKLCTTNQLRRSSSKIRSSLRQQMQQVKHQITHEPKFHYDVRKVPNKKKKTSSITRKKDHSSSVTRLSTIKRSTQALTKPCTLESSRCASVQRLITSQPQINGLHAAAPVSVENADLLMVPNTTYRSNSKEKLTSSQVSASRLPSSSSIVVVDKKKKSMTRKNSSSRLQNSSVTSAAKSKTVCMGKAEWVTQCRNEWKNVGSVNESKTYDSCTMDDRSQQSKTADDSCVNIMHNYSNATAATTIVADEPAINYRSHVISPSLEQLWQPQAPRQQPTVSQQQSAQQNTSVLLMMEQQAQHRKTPLKSSIKQNLLIPVRAQRRHYAEKGNPTTNQKKSAITTATVAHGGRMNNNLNDCTNGNYRAKNLTRAYATSALSRNGENYSNSESDYNSCTQQRDNKLKRNSSISKIVVGGGNQRIRA